MANTLTWLHLSDLHMQSEASNDVQVVLDALWNDIPKQIEKIGGQLDFIAFTGDITHSGKKEEYKLAEKHFFEPLLQATEVARDKLFIVPGNHDVDRDLIDVINPAIPYSLTDRDTVTELLKNNARRRLLFGAMSGYTNFVQDYFSSATNHQILRDPSNYYVQHLSVGNRSIALIGLNSAWLSGLTKDANGKTIDRGNLLIGDKQVGDAIREAKDVTMRIALMHHPPSWLKEFDESDVKRWLRSGCEFVLRGHLHVPEFVIEKTLGGETISIPAGTVYGGHEWLNGYNLVHLDFDTGQGQIILRRYGEQRRKWVKDVLSTGDDVNGIVEFDLPASLAPSTSFTSSPSPSLASQVLSEIEPRWLRLGRDQETQRLEDFLKQKTRHTLWVYGQNECGLNEFLQIARSLLEYQDVDIIHFDAEDATFGVAIDHHYFLDRLEHWLPSDSEGAPDQANKGIDQRLRHWLTNAKSHLEKSNRRLVLIFANCHLPVPAIRKWVRNVLWNQIHESLVKYSPLAIFACEGPVPACPANGQDSNIHLAEFTVQDVERFLYTLPSLDFKRVPKLARKIHSKNSYDFMAPPQRVYRNLIVELTQRGVTTQPTTSQPTQPLATPPLSSTVNTQPDDILIVTVTEVEAKAVLDVFSQAAGKLWTRQVIGQKTYYNLGVHGGVPVFMVQSEMGIATPSGALLTVRQAIQDLDPQAIIMCGITLGLRPDKQQLGDILVAKQIQYYEPQKVDMQRGQMPRGDRATSAGRLLDRFRSGDLDWQGAPSHFGLVLSGEKLVNDSTFRDRLLETEPEAIGSEMEGAGLYAAARDAKVDWILVKAIYDWADGEKNDNAHLLAASNAAQFVLHVLQLGGWDEVKQ